MPCRLLVLQQRVAARSTVVAIHQPVRGILEGTAKLPAQIDLQAGGLGAILQFPEVPRTFKVGLVLGGILVRGTCTDNVGSAAEVGYMLGCQCASE